MKEKGSSLQSSHRTVEYRRLEYLTHKKHIAGTQKQSNWSQTKKPRGSCSATAHWHTAKHSGRGTPHIAVVAFLLGRLHPFGTSLTPLPLTLSPFPRTLCIARLAASPLANPMHHPRITPSAPFLPILKREHTTQGAVRQGAVKSATSP